MPDERKKSKKVYYCPKCGTVYHYQMHRGWLVKAFSFLFPVKKFFCAKCKKAHYVSTKKRDAASAG